MTVLGLLAPTAIHSPYYLGLLINAIMLAISAVSIGFLAHQSGLMMFGAAAFTGGATYLYAIAITQFGWNVMAASAFTLLASTLSLGADRRADRARAAASVRHADARARANAALVRADHRFPTRHGGRRRLGAQLRGRFLRLQPSPAFEARGISGRSRGWRSAASWRWPGRSVDPPPGRCCAPSKPTRSACAFPASIPIGPA